MVNVLAFYFDNPSLNPGEACLQKLWFERTKIMQKEARVGQFILKKKKFYTIRFYFSRASKSTCMRANCQNFKLLIFDPKFCQNAIILFVRSNSTL